MKIIPWRISNFFNVHFHSLYMFFKFKTTNLNTQKHWDERFSKDGYQESINTENIFLAMEELIAPDAFVCDVGVGSGYFLKRLKERKTANIFGIDISPVIINKLKECGIDGCVCELPAKPPIDCEFDFITAKALLEHLKYPRQSISTLSDMLKPGGKLIVSVPNDRLGPEAEPEHFRKYNKETLFEELNDLIKVQQIEIVDNCLLAVCVR